MDFAKRLKEARINAGLSQLQAAQKASVNVRQWQFYESGKRLPSVLIGRHIADALGVSLDWLTSD